MPATKLALLCTARSVRITLRPATYNLRVALHVFVIIRNELILIGVGRLFRVMLTLIFKLVGRWSYGDEQSFCLLDPQTD